MKSDIGYIIVCKQLTSLLEMVIVQPMCDLRAMDESLKETVAIAEHSSQIRHSFLR
jgi:hypothetical protein